MTCVRIIVLCCFMVLVCAGCPAKKEKQPRTSAPASTQNTRLEPVEKEENSVPVEEEYEEEVEESDAGDEVQMEESEEEF